MKTVFFMALCALTQASFAQTSQPYRITGKIANLQPPAKIHLTYKRDGGHVADSAIFNAGNFQIAGSATEPFYAVLVIDYNGIGLFNMDRRKPADVLRLYVDKGSIEVTSNDSLKHAVINGSAINQDYVILNAVVEPLEKQINELEMNRSADTFLLAKLKTDRLSKLRQFIIAHPDSYLSLVALEMSAGRGPEGKLPSGSAELLSSTSETLKETSLAKKLAQRIANEKELAIGNIIPDFTQSDPNHRPVSLSNFRGKYVLLDFWASWCGPCRQENPNLVRIYQRFKPLNFEIIGISLDKPDGEDSWKKAIKDDRLTWPQVSDLKGWSNELVGKFSIAAIPQNFLIDPDGRIVAKNLYGDALQNFLEKLLLAQNIK